MQIKGQKYIFNYIDHFIYGEIMKKLFYAGAAALLILTNITFAQESRAGKFGIGYSGSFTENSNSLSATYWVSDNFKIEPEVGVSHLTIEGRYGAGGTKETGVRLGIGFAYTLSDLLANPYVGLRVRDVLISTKDNTYSDMIYTLAFGGEYFISGWFSTGAEMRVNYIKTDPGYSPYIGIANAKLIETEQVINFKLYFN